MFVAPHEGWSEGVPLQHLIAQNVLILVVGVGMLHATFWWLSLVFLVVLVVTITLIIKVKWQPFELITRRHSNHSSSTSTSHALSVLDLGWPIFELVSIQVVRVQCQLILSCDLLLDGSFCLFPVIIHMLVETRVWLGGVVMVEVLVCVGWVETGLFIFIYNGW